MWHTSKKKAWIYNSWLYNISVADTVLPEVISPLHFSHGICFVILPQSEAFKYRGKWKMEQKWIMSLWKEDCTRLTWYPPLRG